MKAVLISIQPKWCELIANGKKTVEVRKTKPKLETPFKVYIYATKGEALWKIRKRPILIVPTYDNRQYVAENEYYSVDEVQGKVIGEFVCRNIDFLKERDLFEGMDEISNSRIEEYSCLSIDELLQYKGNKEDIYGWHISDLVIYDEPKELSEFRYHCRYEFDDDFKHCDKCEYHHFSNTPSSGREEWCGCDGLKRLSRPSQSWCYVEERSNR